MKVRILAIERILKVGEFITAAEILNELEGRFGITADRKTIYDDIQAISKIIPVESSGGRYGGFKLLNVLVESGQAPFDKDGYICPHNQECRCQIIDCSTCGWNPKVEKMRLEKYLQQKEDLDIEEG